MPGTAAKIRMSEKQLAVIEELSRSVTVSAAVKTRATILLLGFRGLRNEHISPVVGLERHQVGRWRRRSRDAWDALCLWECAACGNAGPQRCGRACWTRWRRAFLSDPRHRIRFVDLPKHSSWLNQIEIVFGIIHRKCVRGASFGSVAQLESRLREFIDYYNRTMAHPFRWRYTGQPVAKPRRARFTPPHHRLQLHKPGRQGEKPAPRNRV